ncbi:MAG: hypothetical protein ABI175_28920, partial [Polyangiales bacterium]
MGSTFRRALLLAAGVHVLALIFTQAIRAPETRDDGAATEATPPATASTTEMFAVLLLDEAPTATEAIAAMPRNEAAQGDDQPPPSPLSHVAITTTPKTKLLDEAKTSDAQDPPSPIPGEGAPIANAPPQPMGTAASPYVLPELGGKKPSWLLPPILPNAVGAAGTGAPGAQLDGPLD